ncbi:MAG: hypothetical protein ACE5KU_04320 [Nitrososphaerales archaeon]
MSSSGRFARDAWMVIVGFMIGLTLGYGVILGFYQPEIFRLQDEVRAKSERCEADSLMYHIADASLYYIEQNHPEVASSIPKVIAWQGSRTTPEGFMGHETYVYRGEGWKVTIEWDVVSFENLKYTVTVEHNSLIWKGEIYRGDITEISFQQ